MTKQFFMHFTTIQFAIFFLGILTLNWVLRRRTGPFKIFLLIANYVFYGFWDARFLLVLAAVSSLDYLCALGVASAANPFRKKNVMIACVVLNLGTLAFFKYLEFVFDTLLSFGPILSLAQDMTVPEVVFPVGISFFSFQGLSYVIDVYREPRRVVRNPLDVFIFVSFFPTIMSGPIMRAGSFIPQIARPVLDGQSFQTGFALVLSGLFKKVVIASYLSEHIVRQVFQVPENYSSLTVLAAIYSYSVQIFCDFSGYSDLAMGIALLLGFRIPENFRAPYASTSLQDFWRRWHISLSTWLRDYLYFPLGGNRKGWGRKYINLMLTMLLGGLWHGAHARFLLWGALHGLGVTLTHVYQDFRSNRIPRNIDELRRNHDRRNGQTPVWKKLVAWFLTFHFVSFLWVFFRADNAGRAFEIFGSVFRWNQTGDGFEWLVPAALLVGMGIQWFGHLARTMFVNVQTRLPWAVQATVIGLLCIIILQLGPDGVLPFIYFQF